MATVRHWPNGYAHDHKGPNLRVAAKIALKCAANETPPESVVAPVATKLAVRGRTSFAGEWFEVVKH